MPNAFQFIEKLMGEGRFLEARNSALQELKTSDELRLKQLLALSMAKSGAPKAAMDFLEPVHQQHTEDAETAGILGSIYKELFKETKNSKYALLSRDTYLKNFQLTGNYYTGINAASMSAIGGSLSKAREIAKEIVANVNESSTDPWHLATLGEAYLLLKEKEKSHELYLRSRQLFGAEWGKVNSVFNQLWLLNHYIAVSKQIMNTFQPPAVAAFIGHMVDHPSRKISRFPSSIENEVKDGIVGAIKSVNAKIGYCSLACGGDIIFAEAMIQTGGEVNLFLPFDKEDFINVSVAFAGDEWVDRFNKLVAQFPVKMVTGEKYLGTDDLFSFQSEIIFGSAINRSSVLHASSHLITVFSDMDTKAKPGGTRDTLKHWPLPEKRININPQNFLKSSSHPVTQNAGALSGFTVSAPLQDETRMIRYLLFASIQSSSPEHEERFHYHVDKKISTLGEVKFQKDATSYLFAFETIGQNIESAWYLLKALSSSLPQIKISMHAGPVYLSEDNTIISGSTADQVKQIQEFGYAGKVYASFQYASVLTLESDKYAIEYAGLISAGSEMPLEIYQLNRHSEAFDL